MTTPTKPGGPGLRYAMNTWEDDGRVLTELRSRMDSAEKTLCMWVTDTREIQTRRALEKLGWLAPDANLQDAIRARCDRCLYSGVSPSDSYFVCNGCIGNNTYPDRFKENP